MATPRQVAANLQNAQLSTGPKTEEGKQASRRNALKHGLTGDGIVQSEADAALFEHRASTWRKGYALDTEPQEFAFQRMILASVRMTRCVDDELAVRTQTAHRAQVSWDEDHRRDVERLAQRIHRKPSLIVAELNATRHGCEWMLVRWKALDTAVAWDEAQTELALDLLGVPTELRSLYRFPDDDPAACARREMARLERRLDEALIPLDEEERDLAEAGQELTPSRERLRLQRYEAAAVREYYKALALLTPADSKPVEPVVCEVPAAPPPPPLPVATEEDYARKTAEQYLQLQARAAEAAPDDQSEGLSRGHSIEEFRAALGGSMTLTEVLERFACKTNPMAPYAGQAIRGVQAKYNKSPDGFFA